MENNKRSYTIQRVKTGFDWDKIEKAPIDQFAWLHDYSPETFGQIVLCDDKEFIIKLTCIEKNPLATFKNYGDTVWVDSCLEFFVAFDAQKPNKYMNCEMNSAGASFMNIGTKGEGKRVAIDKIIGHVPEYKPEVLEDRWSVVLHLTLEDIKKLFGDIEFKTGYKFTANMYKCGDRTEFEHYGMWNLCVNDEPQFHLPQYFGEMIIG